MKFNRATAFEKHLLEAKKEHLAPVYLLAIPDAYERKRMAEQVAARIGFFYPDGTFTTKEAVPIVHLLDELNTISLFEKSRIVFYDSIQSIRKEDLNSLTRYFTNPASSTFLLLGISHAKTAQEIYMEGKKDLISCDFTEEKPWDRKERLKNYLRGFVTSRKKKCSSSLIEQLLEKRGMDLAILEQDLEKIITFIGERLNIEEMDLAAICTDQKLANLWQLSDGILFSKQKISLDSEIDISCLLSLIGQMRLQLQRSLEIRTLLEKKIPHAEIFSKFPAIKKNPLEKLFSFAQEKEEKWLIQALYHLFQTEMLAKNSAATPAVLLHMLNCQLSF
ncbi:DNA polymerase III subunit delta [Candidatus Rhabdochlamydia sp. T3358]|uniref:DNA polymerase III subunit delta n=1 Tax=Candidatus Rhabdochlamydia sp. T3358 TaxID=2099795 RepID=UPI0010BA6703|nr:hypothetical protein [Candidatus Rhabdochlamydia sp. T3358]VHO02844.1 DNA polymerase III subunit delta [Candidatus Rhabdochlamydia sp. T3358]